MRVVVDTRERVPWTFETQGFSFERKMLEAGDYSISGLERRVAIERKSMDDFVHTVLRERARFYRELEALRALDFRCVIVEGGVRGIMESQFRSRVSPAAILGFVGEISVAQSVPVYLAGGRAEAQILAGALLRAASVRFAPAVKA